MVIVEGGWKVVRRWSKVVGRWLKVVGRWFWFHKIVFTGGLPPPDPPLFLGGFQPPRPPGGGPAAPHAPLHTERLRLSGSPFFLGTKILEAPNLWVRLRRRFLFFSKMVPIFLEAPNLGAGS